MQPFLSDALEPDAQAPCQHPDMDFAIAMRVPLAGSCRHAIQLTNYRAAFVRMHGQDHHCSNFQTSAVKTPQYMGLCFHPGWSYRR